MLIKTAKKIALSLVALQMLVGASSQCLAGTKAVTSVAKLPIWSNGIKVPYRAWLPQDRPREILLCVHGLGFNSQSFTEFGRTMAGRGVAVYAVDVRGFGLWMQKKGEDRVDFENCLLDIESGLKTLHKNYPGVPVYLVGESMGGAIALAATSRYPKLVDGLISSVPSSDRYAKLKSQLIVGAHYVKNKDKEMNIAPEVVNRATKSVALRKKWEAEPLNRMTITPKELKQFDDFMKGNNDAAALVDKVPVLMIAGFKDKLVKPEGTIELFNNISNQDKLLMVVGDGEHLLLEENQLTDQLEQLIFDWIKNESSTKSNNRKSGVTAHP
ncbi:MAG: alpha/beta fold hydrolase [Candidatus Obscuribacterales bacterium]|nr:alpha/beta fold hydrolase [Candidatus Obscuribacterales bacterium]